MRMMGKEGSISYPGRLLIWSLLLALLLFVSFAGQASAQRTLALHNAGNGVFQTQATAPDTSCSKESPYGFTTITVDQALVERYQELDVCWVRYQIHENDLRGPDGSYNWSKLDQAVALMDGAGIFMDVPLQCFSGPGTSCFGSNPSIPTVKEMTSFAREIASRYNGKAGHGTIEAFEIGNEEYDQNTGVTAQEYAALLEAGYSAIKKEHPQALVGMYGPYKITLSRLEEVMTALSDVQFDFANVHYYGQGEDPDVSRKDHPSYREVIEAIQEWLPEKPIWVTEIGWATSCTNVKNCKPVTEETQVDYLQQVMADSEEVGVGKVFWFTLNYGNLGYSLYTKSGKPVLAYDAFAQIVQEKPVWDTGGGEGGSDSDGSDSGGGNTLDPTCESVMEQEQDGTTILITTTCSWTEDWIGEEEETISCSLLGGQENSDQSSKESQTCKQQDLERICLDAAKAGFELAVCTNMTTDKTTGTKASTLVLGLPLSLVADHSNAFSDLSPEPVHLFA